MFLDIIAEQAFNVITQAPLYVICSQLVLIIGVAWILVHKTKTNRSISPEIKLAIIKAWNPEPIVGETDSNHPALSPKLITGAVGKYITVQGKKCLNMGSHNYLGLLENKYIKEKSIESLHKYGVGSCGPRGFYGTVDVHLELEERLAKFMNMEEAVVYSYGFSTIASAIPAYSKRNDVIFIDEKVSFASQKGLDASRSKINYFKHNDMDDLERLLVEQQNIDLKNSKKAARCRRFLIVEGIYMNTGTICPLPKLIELKKKYKVRLFVDETISFGTLGCNGRGVTEYFNVDREDVDLISASLDWAVASIGGFCVGSSFIVEHQRLSGLGYCFSASLPPLLTQAAISALDLFEENPEMFKQLQNCCEDLDIQLRGLTMFSFEGNKLSPIKHLFLKDHTLIVEEQIAKLDEIVDKCMDKGLAIVRSAYLEGAEKFPIRPTIRLVVNNNLTQTNIKFVVDTLETVALSVL